MNKIIIEELPSEVEATLNRNEKFYLVELAEENTAGVEPEAKHLANPKIIELIDEDEMEFG